MYTPPPPPSTVFVPKQRSNKTPLLALCLLALILFLIAATIVIALIPVYIQNKDAKLGGYSQTYYFILSPAETLGDDGVLGEDDKQRIAQAISTKLGFTPDALTIDGNVVAATQNSGKRKRELADSIRNKRQVKSGQNVYAHGRFKRDACQKEKCVDDTTNIQIAPQITYGGKTRTVSFTGTIYLYTINVPATQSSSTSTSTTASPLPAVG